MKGKFTYEKARKIHARLYGLNGKTKYRNQKEMYFVFLNYLRISAYRGNVNAQYDYGQQFESVGFLGVENPLYNPGRAFYWYKKAASQGHPAAHNNLAHMLETGEGCTRDTGLALLHYREAARLGDKQGAENLKILRRQLENKNLNL